MEKYYFGQFSDEHLLAIREGIKLFNGQFYWECHEELEDLWLEHVGDNARFVYWAIIQVAASLYHYRNGNILGAWGMMKKAQDKLNRLEKNKVETDLLYKYLSWHKFKNAIRRINESTPLDGYEELFNFRFSSPDKWDVSKNEDSND
ncbi:DUF309 domain-containing protein [Halobacteriovorax sp. GB3]|uniref:DUF309 domain-containing protein n=1 Tax=Halobacteriovorax sp. GB3 TaxID=2719615 RepID=UPI002363002C|nr:DUF309 domain-containing protein [Halobacteriovorax sp. GB3]MDD0852411.1 DUF309 domain-containing protein [Halobacteriovorax sp. GB3]